MDLSRYFKIKDSPLKKNVLANFFGIGVQLVNQVVLVPFYILLWGNELYSDWIVISALTTIFAMSDVGLNNVIQNRFAISLSEGKNKECDSLLMDNYLLVAITLLITLLGCLVFLWCFDITKVMTLHYLSRGQAGWVLIILIIKVFIGMFSGIENAIYRATHKASIAVYMDQVGNLLVALITLLCIITKTSVIFLCVLICLPQLLLVVFKHFHSKKYYDHDFHIKSANWSLFKSVLLPSLSFMSFPVGNMIIYEGYTLVVNGFFGAESVVLFNTTRTLCNFIKQLWATFQNAVWPEYSIAYGEKNYDRMRSLHRRLLSLSILLSVSCGIGLLLFGPFIYKVWTHGAVTFSYSLMTAYVIALVVESLWSSSGVTLMATNNHSRLGVTFIISASIGIILSVMFSMFYPRLWIVAATLIIVNILVCFYTIPAGFKLTKDTIISNYKNIIHDKN